MSKWKMIFLAGAVLMFGAHKAKADSTPVVLTFEGVGNTFGKTPMSVGNFYNGGAGGNLGFVFGLGFLGLTPLSGGNRAFTHSPACGTILFFFGACYVLNF